MPDNKRKKLEATAIIIAENLAYGPKMKLSKR